MNQSEKAELIKACEGLQDDLAEATMWKLIYKTIAAASVVIIIWMCL